MNLLAIDTSSKNVSISIMRHDKIIVDFNQQWKWGSSKVVFVINALLEKNKISLHEFDAFVLGAGPGSFTGLRISFSVVKAFALSLKKPVITIGSFFSMACPLARTHPKITVITDARRSLIYSAHFGVKQQRLVLEGKEKLSPLSDVVNNKKDFLFVTYDEHLRQEVKKMNAQIHFYSKNIYPQAKYLLIMGQEKFRQKKFTAVEKLEPLYLHPQTCQITKRNEHNTKN